MTASLTYSAQQPESLPLKRTGGKRRRYALIVVVLTMVALLTLHAPLLRGVACLLIVDQPVAKVTHVAILGCGGRYGGPDRRYRAAAELFRSHALRAVLLFEAHRTRLVREGILPPDELVGREQLLKHRVPEPQISTLPGEARNIWDMSDRLGDWLRAHPTSRVVALADRFQSRQARVTLDAVLDPKLAQRVVVRALPDRRYDETDWWHSRRGWKSVFTNACGLAAVWIYGRPDPSLRDDWDPDEYERQLRLKWSRQER